MKSHCIYGSDDCKKCLKTMNEEQIKKIMNYYQSKYQSKGEIMKPEPPPYPPMSKKLKELYGRRVIDQFYNDNF